MLPSSFRSGEDIERAKALEPSTRLGLHIPLRDFWGCSVLARNTLVVDLLLLSESTALLLLATLEHLVAFALALLERGSLFLLGQGVGDRTAWLPGSKNYPASIEPWTRLGALARHVRGREQSPTTPFLEPAMQPSSPALA
jgi:hypothetical protein